MRSADRRIEPHADLALRRDVGGELASRASGRRAVARGRGMTSGNVFGRTMVSAATLSVFVDGVADPACRTSFAASPFAKAVFTVTSWPRTIVSSVMRSRLPRGRVVNLGAAGDDIERRPEPIGALQQPAVRLLHERGRLLTDRPRLQEHRIGLRRVGRGRRRLRQRRDGRIPPAVRRRAGAAYNE